MSNAVFPTLPGLAWSVGKYPEFSTLVSRSASGAETRIALWSTPIWHFKLTFEVLRDDITAEMRTLAGFFLARRGKYESFLFEDPDDHHADGQALGVGDGTTTTFQCVRSFGGFVEPVKALNDNRPVSIRVDGAALDPSQWTVDDSGLFTLASAPEQNAVVAAAFDFYFRVRFDMDTAEFEKFMYQLWQLKTCDLVSVK